MGEVLAVDEVMPSGGVWNHGANEMLAISREMLMVRRNPHSDEIKPRGAQGVG